jgi:hypothetical protein
MVRCGSGGGRGQEAQQAAAVVTWESSILATKKSEHASNRAPLSRYDERRRVEICTMNGFESLQLIMGSRLFAFRRYSVHPGSALLFSPYHRRRHVASIMTAAILNSGVPAGYPPLPNLRLGSPRSGGKFNIRGTPITREVDLLSTHRTLPL